jgi:transposase
MTYSIDFRRKVISIKEQEGLSYKQTAVRFGIGKTTLVRWKQKLEPESTRNKPATKIDMEALKVDIKKYPDSYHYERAKRLGVGIRTVGDALKRLNVTYKKKA